MKTIMFVGHGRAGKDTACEYLSQITTLRNAGTTSKYLTNYVAQKLNLPPDVAYERRHESDETREKWYRAGNEIRSNGATTLIRMALANGEITGGVRDRDEIVAAREEGLIDLIVWIDNNRVPVDPTVKFSEQECDIIIPNHWSIEEFRGRIERFAKFAGLPLRALNVVRKQKAFEAMQFDGSKESFNQIYDWMNGDDESSQNGGYKGTEDDPEAFDIVVPPQRYRTCQPRIMGEVRKGDWVLKDKDGIFHPCEAEVFNRDYEREKV